MFGIGSTELLVILVVALIILGPAKLPEIAKSLGKALGEFRRVSSDVKRTIEMEVEQEEQRAKTEEARKELYPESAGEASPAKAEETAGESAQTAEVVDVESESQEAASDKSAEQDPKA